MNLTNKIKAILKDDDRMYPWYKVLNNKSICTVGMPIFYPCVITTSRYNSRLVYNHCEFIRDNMGRYYVRDLTETPSEVIHKIEADALEDYLFGYSTVIDTTHIEDCFNALSVLERFQLNFSISDRTMFLMDSFLKDTGLI